MKNIVFLLLSFLFALSVMGQQGTGEKPTSIGYYMKNQRDINSYIVTSPNMEVLKNEDKINDSLKTGPWRFGYNYETSINLNNNGTWITKDNGDRVWLMEIRAKGAKTINLTFKNTEIPEGNGLYVYHPQGKIALGKFTQNHIYKGELGAELIEGGVAVVEYHVPAYNNNNIGRVEIGTITYGYRTQEEFYEKAFGSSALCHINVNCADGAPYKNQRNSTVMLVAGSNGFCTGALINNTEFDGTPYVLTANHCTTNHSNYASWIFRFNWQSAGCPNPSESPSFESLSGAELRAKRSGSDFCLVEITGGLESGQIPELYTPYFSGWNRGETPASSTFCIHHPRGDIKKISFADSPALAEDYPNSSHEPNNSWMVFWDRGTATETGSSGSPLFNQDGQIIGQLWGGNSSCSNSGNGGKDYYGRLVNSWNPEESDIDEQLEYWLDPNQSGTEFITGYDPFVSPMDYNVTALKVSNFKENICRSNFEPKIEIQNNGDIVLTTLTINYTYNNGATQEITWSGNLEKYQVETITLPEFTVETGTNTLEVNLKNPNGSADEDMSDNSLSASFDANLDGVSFDFQFLLGCFADEVSWKLIDENSNELYSGGNYPGPSNSNYLVQEEFCLMEGGCYKLILNDEGDDGVEGSYYSGCNHTGSMVLTNTSGDLIVAELLEEHANFGSSISFEFCADYLSVESNNLNHQVKIFPNPSVESFKVEMDFEGLKIIKVYNLLGEIIEMIETTEVQKEINVEELSAGTYFVNIYTQYGSITKKVIIGH